jgi:hypothetical protein
MRDGIASIDRPKQDRNTRKTAPRVRRMRLASPRQLNVTPSFAASGGKSTRRLSLSHRWQRGYMMPLPNQLVGQIRDDTFGAIVEVREKDFIQKCNPCNFRCLSSSFQSQVERQRFTRAAAMLAARDVRCGYQVRLVAPALDKRYVKSKRCALRGSFCPFVNPFSEFLPRVLVAVVFAFIDGAGNARPSAYRGHCWTAQPKKRVVHLYD